VVIFQERCLGEYEVEERAALAPGVVHPQKQRTAVKYLWWLVLLIFQSTVVEFLFLSDCAWNISCTLYLFHMYRRG
jgi:hypothetical protein